MPANVKVYHYGVPGQKRYDLDQSLSYSTGRCFLLIPLLWRKRASNSRHPYMISSAVRCSGHPQAWAVCNLIKEPMTGQSFPIWMGTA